MTKVNTSLPLTERLAKAPASGSFQSTYKKLSERYHSGSRSETFQHIVASPICYEKGYPYPLLVWLHDAEKTEKEIFDVVPRMSTRNYVAVAPRGSAHNVKRVVRSFVNGRLTEESHWFEPCFDWADTEDNVSETENLVFDSIAEASAKYNVNMRRVFLLGHGTGGTMALRVAMRNPRAFAGVVSIDGELPDCDSIPLRNWRALRDLPVLVTAGNSASTSVPKLNPELLRLYHTAGLTVLVRQYNEEPRKDRGSQTRMKSLLADVNRWIMDRSLNPQDPTAEIFSQCN